jgi:hypothetical protein
MLIHFFFLTATILLIPTPFEHKKYSKGGSKPTQREGTIQTPSLETARARSSQQHRAREQQQTNTWRKEKTQDRSLHVAQQRLKKHK